MPVLVRPKTLTAFALCLFLLAAILLTACTAEPPNKSRAPNKPYVVVKPGAHPGIIFSDQELPALRKRARGSGTAATAYSKIKKIAETSYEPALTVKQAVARPGRRLSKQLEAMALVYQIEQDKQLGRKAVELFQSVATTIDPAEFYREVDQDFFATEHWPKAFAFAWDWLYHLMTPTERQSILASLEQWNAALFDHTENAWWRAAGYNCGAIPVGAQGLLLTSIQAETSHPKFERWFSECFRKTSKNYFPQTWSPSGICNEGPGYAHYHKNPTQFAEAVRRTGGPDIIGSSGAVNAMHYLRHQWMPQGGCGPVGDNTDYGRRVFQAIYLHGIRELGDAAGLWTFENFTDFDRIDPILIFLFYPGDLTPVSPGKLDLRTSFYFEIDRDRAGNVFARSEWDNEQAAWFNFVTRYSEANHTHYDMNSFLFTAFGEPFATHDNIYLYSGEHHGADFEHNIVVIDEGGMPAADRPSAGDDGSLHGLMTGLGLGHFADYVRGDASLSYKDRSVRSSTPALRADRSVLFVKQGPNPYIVVADDIQKDSAQHDYHWQWFTPARSISGAGTLAEPFLIEGENARCKIAFLTPEKPSHDFQVVKGGYKRRPIELGLLRVNRKAVRATYLAVAAAWRKGAKQPVIRHGPPVETTAATAASTTAASAANNGTANAATSKPASIPTSIIIEGEGFRDQILWRRNDTADATPRTITAGKLQTDALMALVRTDPAGAVTGYLIGDGKTLIYDGRTLVQGPRPFSVSADKKRTFATGPRRPAEALPPHPAQGRIWLPNATSEIWADDKHLNLAPGLNQIVTLNPANPSN